MKVKKQLKSPWRTFELQKNPSALQNMKLYIVLISIFVVHMDPFLDPDPGPAPHLESGTIINSTEFGSYAVHTVIRIWNTCSETIK